MGTRTASTNEEGGAPTTGRHLSVVGFVVIAIVFLAIVQGISFVLTRGIDMEYAAPTSVDEVWRAITLPVFVSLVFVYAVVAFLRWWRPVFVDDRPVRRWVIVIPIVMLVTVVLGTNYAGLADRGVLFVVLLLLGTLMVGFAEEGMFRGLGVVTFRINGFTEGKVALWTCILFGLAHSTNLISEGPKAFLQVFVTAVAGYFFYLIRRRSGGLVVAALMHGLWDFGTISGAVEPGETYALTALFVLTDIVMAIVVLVRRHHIEPELAAAAVNAPSG